MGDLLYCDACVDWVDHVPGTDECPKFRRETVEEKVARLAERLHACLPPPGHPGVDISCLLDRALELNPSPEIMMLALEKLEEQDRIRIQNRKVIGWGQEVAAPRRPQESDWARAARLSFKAGRKDNPSIKVHEIGEFQVVETYDDLEEPAGFLFFAYYKGERLGLYYSSLDAALLGLLLYKYNDRDTSGWLLAARMLGMIATKDVK